MKRRAVVVAALLVGLAALGAPARGQPVPMPEVVAETPVIAPPVPVAAPEGSSTSSGRRAPASVASEAQAGVLDRTG